MGTKTFMCGMTAGAGLVYLLDRDRGQVRRTRWSSRIRSMVDEVAYVLEASQAPGSPLRSVSYGSRIGDLEGLGDATLRSAPRAERSSGSSKTALKVAGGLLAIYGLTRRGKLATLLRSVGTGLLLDSATRGRSGIPGFSTADRRRAVDVQKTLYIDAPVDQVYAFWSNYKNFPLFMSHVREVEDLGGGRSHWSVSGPGGLPIEWSAVLTQQVPEQVIAWRSEAGSMLENAGVIRFVAAGSGTRVNLRFCYHPPAGGAGVAVAQLLGSDPRAKLNEDLGRMKSLLEATTRSGTHGKESQP
ncbi:MAG TPA: SRPBCC family protein [Gemmatimonadales bacterium]|nr:SRPBCC family protein [Gemmatimonadales bacterium]